MLCESLRKETGVAYKINCLRLLNHLIDTPEEISARQEIRKPLLALHLDHILVDLKGQDDTLDELITSFESSKEEDEEEIQAEKDESAE